MPGRTGSFEVSLGGRVLFSKLQTDRFPEENEAEERVGEALHQH